MPTNTKTTPVAVTEPHAAPVLDAAVAASSMQVARVEGGAVAGRDLNPVTAASPVVGRIEGVEFSRDQIELIKRTIAAKATDDELDLFLYTSRRLKLDPFGRQIYFIKRRQWDSDSGDYIEVGQTQVSIDGFRLVAERTGEYQGQLPHEWARVRYADGDFAEPVIDWYPVWPFPGENPYAARVGVVRRGFSQPLFAVARFDAFKQTKKGGALTAMWVKRGAEQLAKCAEALALRAAFPQELSGVYTPDEMAQASNEDDDDAPPPQRAPQRQSAQRDASSSTSSGRAKPAAASGPPRRVATRDPFPFPFEPRKGVALDALYPVGDVNGGEYQVSNTLLARAVQWASHALDTGMISQGKGKEQLAMTDEQRISFTRLLDALALEQEERHDEEQLRAAPAAAVEGQQSSDPTVTATASAAVAGDTAASGTTTPQAGTISSATDDASTARESARAQSGGDAERSITKELDDADDDLPF